ncbi:hypothetical protein ILUMI_16108 [Ignelater luminosus]|uniref:DDE-1 domain-containing protein n=1 Tax=Ignelater luminosus TaxID=2038154 RepID=A0A8K0CRU6_IGNLU|nr:hypothetical protein ILUMI_16108 [Ignelater luminosus]
MKGTPPRTIGAAAPSGWSNKVQPLDRTVFGPFKTYYDSAVNQWMLTPANSGKPLSIYEVAEMVGHAYLLSFAANDHEFLPSYVTNRPLPDAPTTSSDVLSSLASSSRLDTTTNTSITSPKILKPFSKS